MADLKALEPTKIITIAGPTGAGKTGLAINLARRFNGEIIGADAMQIYRFMDIGTAKPTPDERAAIPHHMIDVVDPEEDFDAAAYADLAHAIIRQVSDRGRTVFVVGGTGLYIKALIHGLFPYNGSDPAVRRRLKQCAQADGGAAIYQRLAEVDGAAAQKIHPNDTYRIIRALEVFEVTGEPLTVFHQRHGFREKRYETLELGISWPRQELYARIDQRVDHMLEQGFVDEVRRLLAMGYGRDLKSMQSLGYRHMTAFLRGESTLEQAVATLKRDHRRYAKRQLTWFNANQSVNWIHPQQADRAADRTGTSWSGRAEFRHADTACGWVRDSEPSAVTPLLGSASVVR